MDSDQVLQSSDLDAGSFSLWLKNARQALIQGTGTDVNCGDCTACCSSSYFIHITPKEKSTLEKLDKKVLAHAPGLPKGNVLMAHDQNGLCPMLKTNKCTIYANRPQTCRSYDCRVFAAAGITAGEQDKFLINQQIARWNFSHPTPIDHEEYLAVQAAAKFIRENPESFPGGRTPNNPSQLAIMAIKVYPVFLASKPSREKPAASEEKTPSKLDIATEIVEACRKFDANLPSTHQSI